MTPVTFALAVVGGVFVLVAGGGLVPPDVLKPPSKAQRDKRDFSGVFPATCALDADGASGPEAFRRLLDDAPVRNTLRRAEAYGFAARLVDLQLSLEGKGDPRLRETLTDELADALDRAAWAPWHLLASTFHLRPDHSVPHGLRGSHGSMVVQVTALSAMPLELRARVEVGLSIPPEIRFRAVERLAQGDDAGIELTARGLRAVADRGTLVTTLRSLLTLADGLLAEIGDPWARFADEPDFHPIRGDGSRLEGSRGGVRMTATRGGGEVRFVAHLKQPLPPGTLLVHADFGVVDFEVHDPILDPLLTIQTSDLPALRALIARDDVRGELLDVVHGAPGSTVDAHEVVCVVKAPFGELSAWADKVAALVNALADA